MHDASPSYPGEKRKVSENKWYGTWGCLLQEVTLITSLYHLCRCLKEGEPAQSWVTGRFLFTLPRYFKDQEFQGQHPCLTDLQRPLQLFICKCASWATGKREHQWAAFSIFIFFIFCAICPIKNNTTKIVYCKPAAQTYLPGPFPFISFHLSDNPQG